MNHANFCCPTGRSDLFEKFNVSRVVIGPLFGNIIFVINCFNGTDRLTRATIDTLIGVNVEHPVAFIDAIHGAFVNTCSVFHIHTGKRNYVSHCGNVLSGTGF